MLDKQKWQELLKKAKAGNAEAQADTGLMYSGGYIGADQTVVVRKNSKLACKWYEKAAAQGNTDGICALAYHLDGGIGCEKDTQGAIKLYELAISKGSGVAAFNLGTIYRDKGNYRKAFGYYHLSMCLDGADYSCTVGLCLYYGVGVEQDKSSALLHFRKVSADKLNNHSSYERDLANYYLGVSHLTGECLPKSVKIARRYFELANIDNDNNNALQLLHLIGRKSISPHIS